MKKIFFTTFILFLSTLSLSQSQLIEYWEQINPRGADLKAVDSLHFGFLPLITSSYGGYTIIDTIRAELTNDGGTNWINAFTTVAKDSFFLTFRGWEYFDEKTLFILADSSVQRGYDGLNVIVDTKANIFKTNDGCKSWKQIPINDKWRSRQTTVLSMSDSLNGIIVQFPSKYDSSEKTDQIWHTNDGWVTWKKINAPNNCIANFEAHFENPSTIVAWSYGYQKITKTTDLGISWTVNIIPDSIKVPNAQEKFFYNTPDIYYYIKNNIIYKTTNSGNTWFRFYTHSDPVTGIAVKNDSTVYVYAANPKFTADNGKTWNKLELTEHIAYYNNYKMYVSSIIEFSETNKIGIGNGTLKYSGKKILKAPEFLGPKANFYLPTDFELQWTAIQGADSYHLQIVENKGFELDEPDKYQPPNFDSTLFVNDSMLVDTNYRLKGASYYKTYTCRIRAVNDSMMSPWLSEFWVTMNGTSIEYDNIYKSLLNFSPNPAQDFLNINLNNEFSYSTTIKVFNIHGQIVSKDEIPAGIKNFKINTEKLPSGIYFINCVNGQLAETQKFTVIK